MTRVGELQKEVRIQQIARRQKYAALMIMSEFEKDTLVTISRLGWPISKRVQEGRVYY